jgi:hypothetical protein
LFSRDGFGGVVGPFLGFQQEVAIREVAGGHLEALERAAAHLHIDVEGLGPEAEGTGHENAAAYLDVVEGKRNRCGEEAGDA